MFNPVKTYTVTPSITRPAPHEIRPLDAHFCGPCNGRRHPENNHAAPYCYIFFDAPLTVDYVNGDFRRCADCKAATLKEETPR